MSKEQNLALYNRLENPDPAILTTRLTKNPFTQGDRPNSIYIGDMFFGDSGKGSVAAKFNRIFAEEHGTVWSFRVNGGANAGHDMYIDGINFLANQLPAAVAESRGVGVMTWGMVISPRDLVMEIERTKKTFGGEMPGRLMIDDRAPLNLDTHRAWDWRPGSTKRGIGPAYEDFIGRNELTVGDLMKQDWFKVFAEHYGRKRAAFNGLADYLNHQLGPGENPIASLEETKILQLDGTKVAVGNVDDFLNRLSEDRRRLKPFVQEDMAEIIKNVTQKPEIPLTIEEAQGPFLHPRFGIRPDVTSSNPGSRAVHEGMYGAIFAEDIPVRVAVMKTTYMSSVGSRTLPGAMEPEHASWIQDAFGEKGKTTGRLRGIYYVPIPFAQDLARFTLANYIVPTHVDAGMSDVDVRFINSFKDARGGEGSYRPFQSHIDHLQPEYVDFPGWDGEAAKSAKIPEELPLNARRVLAYLSETIGAPILMATTGQDVRDFVKWWK